MISIYQASWISWFLEKCFLRCIVKVSHRKGSGFCISFPELLSFYITFLKNIYIYILWRYLELKSSTKGNFAEVFATRYSDVFFGVGDVSIFTSVHMWHRCYLIYTLFRVWKAIGQKLKQQQSEGYGQIAMGLIRNISLCNRIEFAEGNGMWNRLDDMLKDSRGF